MLKFVILIFNEFIKLSRYQKINMTFIIEQCFVRKQLCMHVN